MKTYATAAAIAFSTAGTAFADDMYAAGGMAELSNLETQVLAILTDNGVPSSCIGELSLSDVAVIKSIMDQDTNVDEKRDRVKVRLERSCGDLD